MKIYSLSIDWKAEEYENHPNQIIDFSAMKGEREKKEQNQVRLDHSCPGICVESFAVVICICSSNA